MYNINIPSEAALFSRENIIKSIKDLYFIVKQMQGSGKDGEGVVAAQGQQIRNLRTDVDELKNRPQTASQEMPEAWLQADTMNDLIRLINADAKAVKGMSFLSTMFLNDLPGNMGQAEVKAEILQSENIGKVILFTITSEDVEPYHWEYTSAYNRTGEWRTYVLSSELENKEAEILEANKEIYALKKAVGSLGGDVTYDLPNVLGTSFSSLMGNNGTVKLQDDVTTGRFGPGIFAKNHVTLNLNNHNLTCTNAGTYGVILARGSEEITVTGKGTIDADTGICIECNGANAVVNLSGSTTVYQTNRPDAELIYCYAGTINISGGTFKNNGSQYLLNCYDANYQNGTAKIIVTGGKFYDFDPGNNLAEGEGTSYLAEGYISVASTVVEDEVEHTVYTVKRV